MTKKSITTRAEEVLTVLADGAQKTTHEINGLLKDPMSGSKNLLATLKYLLAQGKVIMSEEYYKVRVLKRSWRLDSGGESKDGIFRPTGGCDA